MEREYSFFDRINCTPLFPWYFECCLIANKKLFPNVRDLRRKVKARIMLVNESGYYIATHEILTASYKKFSNVRKHSRYFVGLIINISRYHKAMIINNYEDLSFVLLFYLTCKKKLVLAVKNIRTHWEQNYIDLVPECNLNNMR